MEILSVALLWVMMPLDATPHFPPARVEDLAYFPAEHVILRERLNAWHRKLYAERRRDFSINHGLPDVEYWCVVARQAHHVWDQLDDIHLAYMEQSAGHEEQAVYWLERFGNPWRYLHGYIPPHVDVSEPVEVVPLP